MRTRFGRELRVEFLFGKFFDGFESAGTGGRQHLWVVPAWQKKLEKKKAVAEHAIRWLWRGSPKPAVTDILPSCWRDSCHRLSAIAASRRTECTETSNASRSFHFLFSFSGRTPTPACKIFDSANRHNTPTWHATQHQSDSAQNLASHCAPPLPPPNRPLLRSYRGRKNGEGPVPAATTARKNMGAKPFLGQAAYSRGSLVVPVLRSSLSTDSQSGHFSPHRVWMVTSGSAKTMLEVPSII